MSREDLISIGDRTTAEQQRITRAGGKASGKARRRKRDMQQMLNMLLDMPLKRGKVQNIKSLADVRGKNITAEQAILLAQVQKALKGDTRAAVFIRDTAGCKPSDKVKIEGITAAVLTDEITESNEHRQ